MISPFKSGQVIEHEIAAENERCRKGEVPSGSDSGMKGPSVGYMVLPVNKLNIMSTYFLIPFLQAQCR